MPVPFQQMLRVGLHTTVLYHERECQYPVKPCVLTYCTCASFVRSMVRLIMCKVRTRHDKRCIHDCIMLYELLSAYNTVASRNL